MLTTLHFFLRPFGSVDGILMEVRGRESVRIMVQCDNAPEVDRSDSQTVGFGSVVGCQMPAYHAYPSSAPNSPEPKPLPNCLRLSVIVRRLMYLTFL